MEYKYVKEQPDYSDYTSGRVFYSLPGHPAFPVRLASEIFQRCLAIRNNPSPCALYDPCCGAAFHLSVLAFLHGEQLRQVIASDVDEKAVALARRNLGLLSAGGLDRRIAEITAMLDAYNKDSHRDALVSALLLKNRISTLTRERSFVTGVFQSSATDAAAISANISAGSVDIVFTDVPYGQHSHWQGSDPEVNPLWAMLDALTGILSPAGIVAIASDKQQKVSHERYKRVEQFQVGKRRAVIFKLV